MLYEQIDPKRFYYPKTAEHLEKVEKELDSKGMTLNAELGGLALAIEGHYNGLLISALTPNETYDSYVEQLSQDELAYDVYLTAMAFTPEAVAAAWPYENTPGISESRVLTSAKTMKDMLVGAAEKLNPDMDKVPAYPRLDTSVKFWLEQSRVLDGPAFYSDYNQDEELHCPPVPVNIAARMDESITFRDLIDEPSFLDSGSLAEDFFTEYLPVEKIRDVLNAGLEAAKTNERYICQTEEKNVMQSVENTFNKWLGDLKGISFEVGKGIIVTGKEKDFFPGEHYTADIVFPIIPDDNLDPYATAKQFIAFADYGDPAVIARELVQEGHLEMSDAKYVSSFIMANLNYAANELAENLHLDRDALGKGLDISVATWMKNADPGNYSRTMYLGTETDDKNKQYGLMGFGHLTLRELVSGTNPGLTKATLNLMEPAARNTLLTVIEDRADKERTAIHDRVGKIRDEHRQGLQKEKDHEQKISLW